jgi:hypothetical protein
MIHYYFNTKNDPKSADKAEIRMIFCLSPNARFQYIVITKMDE